MPKVRVVDPYERLLMDHQVDAINWVIDKHVQHPAFFMEMRLGKTLVAVRLTAQIWKVEGPCLVVAPTTVIEAWEKELELEGESFEVVAGLSRKKRIETIDAVQDCPMRRWVLMNYEGVRAIKEIALLPWSVVALDESTAIKNVKSEISNICATGFRDVEHRMILSGLPSPEGQMDLFQQFKFLHGQFLGTGNFYVFRKRYGMKVNSWGAWDVTPDGYKAIQDESRARSFMLRRHEAGLKDMKIKEKRMVSMTPDQKKVYKEVEDEFSTWVTRDGYEELIETEHAAVQQMWLARMAGGCDIEGVMTWPTKIRELIGLMTGELRDQPIVVWFRFNSEIDAVKEALTKKGIICYTLKGEVPREERKRLLQDFRESKIPTRALLCQVKLAKYGIDVSVADTAIYYSLSYSCEEIAQSEDRILHPMKKTPLLYLYLITRSTVDEDVAFAASQKVTSAKVFMTRFRESFKRRRRGG